MVAPKAQRSTGDGGDRPVELNGAGKRGCERRRERAVFTVFTNGHPTTDASDVKGEGEGGGEE